MSLRKRGTPRPRLLNRILRLFSVNTDGSDKARESLLTRNEHATGAACRDYLSAHSMIITASVIKRKAGCGAVCPSLRQLAHAPVDWRTHSLVGPCRASPKVAQAVFQALFGTFCGSPAMRLPCYSSAQCQHHGVLTVLRATAPRLSLHLTGYSGRKRHLAGIGCIKRRTREILR